MANRTHELSTPRRTNAPQLSNLPLMLVPDEDVYRYDEDPLFETGFSVSHHRASMRGRAISAEQEYGAREEI